MANATYILQFKHIEQEQLPAVMQKFAESVGWTPSHDLSYEDYVVAHLKRYMLDKLADAAEMDAVKTAAQTARQALEDKYNPDKEF